MFNYNNEIVQKDMKKIIDNSDFLMLKNKAILITGATGMIATYLIYFLNYLNEKEQLNIKIIGLARNKEKAEKLFAGVNIELLIQNINDKIYCPFAVDYIFHMASSANPSTILSAPLEIIKANTFGTFNTCDLAVEKKAKLIFASTREVYGKVLNKNIIDENDMGIVDCLEKRACYPESKRISETIINSYRHQFGLKYNIIRIAHVYGPGMNIINDGRIMSDIIGNVVNNHNIVLKSDGTALRAFCYLADAISGLLKIITNGKENEVYNLSNEEEEISVKNLAEKVISISKKDLTIEYNFLNTGAYTNYKRIGLNTKKLEKLGWKPLVYLDEGIRNILEIYKYKDN